ncbi:DUF4229 domain-containing protein [Nocardioides sp.]|uniref:DUF4229 domain-containing protein n=1 Tax=Nocardioides sp. TaxID=35761 RepID=UPI002CD2A04C|nr:DUF4229 domain-containing protein [Nocardioides sp.]HSX68166.1 DUF4229 domain-containing protein [Nocardioides sp.]
MKAFVVYTLLRLVLFVCSLVVILGVWKLALGDDSVSSGELFWAVIGAFLISGVASYFVLARQREALARRVEERASKAVSKIDEMRTRED